MVLLFHEKTVRHSLSARLCFYQLISAKCVYVVNNALGFLFWFVFLFLLVDKSFREHLLVPPFNVAMLNLAIRSS